MLSAYTFKSEFISNFHAVLFNIQANLIITLSLGPIEQDRVIRETVL